MSTSVCWNNLRKIWGKTHQFCLDFVTLQGKDRERSERSRPAPPAAEALIQYWKWCKTTWHYIRDELLDDIMDSNWPPMLNYIQKSKYLKSKWYSYIRNPQGELLPPEKGLADLLCLSDPSNVYGKPLRFIVCFGILIWAGSEVDLTSKSKCLREKWVLLHLEFLPKEGVMSKLPMCLTSTCETKLYFKTVLSRFQKIDCTMFRFF